MGKLYLWIRLPIIACSQAYYFRAPPFKLFVFWFSVATSTFFGFPGVTSPVVLAAAVTSPLRLCWPAAAGGAPLCRCTLTLDSLTERLRCMRNKQVIGRLVKGHEGQPRPWGSDEAPAWLSIWNSANIKSYAVRVTGNCMPVLKVTWC